MDGQAILDRLDALAAISERADCLVRRPYTDAHRRANVLVGDWMRAAGMAVRVDAVGNLVGRSEGSVPGAPALLLGSHLDTVVDAGRYDGMLGVVTAIACVGALARRAVRLPFALEVAGFVDEEGVRFRGAALTGSRAMAGRLDPAVLERTDDDGVTLAEAMRGFGLDPLAAGQAARRRDELLAYVELHIEQGPVLEALGLPAGCVTAINGAARYAVTVTGVAGHAGTVPMAARRDALAAAAECVLAVEARAAAEPDLVGTVGRIEALPGAVNVVPGLARFTLDLRAPDDGRRRHAAADLLDAFARIAARRGVGIEPALTHEAAAVPCAPWLMARIERALAAHGVAPHRLPSGAGHDGMALAGLTDIAMIFIRCRGGISHNPAEAISAADAGLGADILLHVIESFVPQAAA